MNMGITFEPLLPLTPDRATSSPAEGAAGDFEDHLRLDGPSRRSEAPQPEERLAAPEQPPSASTTQGSQSISGPEATPADAEAAGVAGDEETQHEAAEADQDATVADATAAAVNATTVVTTPDQPAAATLGAAAAVDSAPATQAATDAEPPHSNAQGPSSPAQTNAASELGSEWSLAEDASAGEAQPALGAEPPRAPRNLVTVADKNPQTAANASPVAGASSQNSGAFDALVSALEGESAEATLHEADSSIDSTTQSTEPATDHALMEMASADASSRGNDASDGQGTTASSSENAVDSQSARLSSADRVRFVQRVARAVEAARPDGEIRLRLRPPELGSIHLRVRTEDGVLAARVETDTRHAQSLLTERLPELRERLAEMNIRLERFDVEYRGSQEERSPSFAQQQGKWDHREPGAPARAAPRPSDARTTTDISRAKLHRGDLDVLV